MNITGIMTVKNAIRCGYTYVEAVLACLPACDRILINDGGSDDDTVKYLNRLRMQYPDKIFIYNIEWGGRNCGAQVDASLNQLIEMSEPGWLWELQGDEIWHEKDLLQIRELVERLDAEGYHSVRHWCKHCSWVNVDSYRYMNVRLVKKVDELVSDEWGDCFHIRGQRSVRTGFTSHNVPPEFVMEYAYYHLHRPFPLNRVSADEAMAFQNTAGDPPREQVLEQVKRIDWTSISMPKQEAVLACLPAIVKGLHSYRKYQVREELFDKDWLTYTTGLEYL